MKLRIHRTSGTYLFDNPICPGAYSEDLKIRRTRRIEDWDGSVICEEYYVVEKRWFVDIDTLEQLILLKQEVGEDIILIDYGDDVELEIYDTYRE